MAAFSAVVVGLAEGVGFEPTVPENRNNGFQDRFHIWHSPQTQELPARIVSEIQALA